MNCESCKYHPCTERIKNPITCSSYIAIKKEKELYCSNCGMMDDSCGCDHPNLKEREQCIGNVN